MISVPLPALTRGFSPFDCLPGDAEVFEAVRTDSVAAAAMMTATVRVRMAAYGKIRSILRQSFWAAAHLLVQSGA